MNNASINLTIDLNSFRQSLTAAFTMYSTMIGEMGKQNPINAKEMEQELRKITDAVKEPIKIKADASGAKIELKDLGGEIEVTKEKSESLWQRNREGLASLALVYNGVMSLYNDVTRVFGGMINQQIEAQQGMARVEAAVRSSGAAAGFTADQLKSLAGGLEGAFAIDADEIMNKVTTPLLTFRAVSGEVFEDAQMQILNMSRALGMDLQGAAMQVGKALQDPVEGLTALRRSGVSFTDQQQYISDRENLQGGPGDYYKLSPEARMNEQITEVRKNLNLAKGELNEFAEAYRQAMLNAPVLKDTGGGGVQGNTGNSSADAAAREAEAQKKEAERMMAELARLRETETAQIEAEYEKRKAIILAYTEDNSEAEKTALADLDAWKTQKEAEITAREKAGMQEKFQAEVQHLANLQEMGVSSYDQLKAKMEEYYAWAKENLSAEEAMLVKKQLQESNLRWGQYQKEKEDKERAHQRTLEDIRAEWNGRNLDEEEQDLNAQLVALERHFEDKKALMIEAGMSEQEIERWLAEEKERIISESEDRIQAKKINTTSRALNQTSGILRNFGDAQNKESKRGFKTWKAMATAQAMVDMASAVLGAFKSQVAIPIVGPILAAAQAAAAMAFGASQIANIQNTEYQPPQAAEGGYLQGPGHSQGGTIIEAEGGEYITKKSRVAELGRGIFDFINNGPIATVRQLFAGMAMPAIEFNAAIAGGDGGGSYFANGGSVTGSNAVTSLLGSLDDKLGRLLEKKVAFDVHIDPLENNPVKVSEIAEIGSKMRSKV